ncbi:MAG: hypothetical protein HC937_03615 [Aquincola sp.]|nr:hypothetical protein [Aquincola sp.]
MHGAATCADPGGHTSGEPDESADALAGWMQRITHTDREWHASQSCGLLDRLIVVVDEIAEFRRRRLCRSASSGNHIDTMTEPHPDINVHRPGVQCATLQRQELAREAVDVAATQRRS